MILEILIEALSAAACVAGIATIALWLGILFGAL